MGKVNNVTRKMASRSMREVSMFVSLWRQTGKMFSMKNKPLDIASYLDNSELIAEYLNVVMREGTAEDVAVAIGHVARAVGMSSIAASTGMSRPSLYKALGQGAHPQFATILQVLHALGLQVTLSPKPTP
jgi:probable addiction module antidote protein